MCHQHENTKNSEQIYEHIMKYIYIAEVKHIYELANK